MPIPLSLADSKELIRLCETGRLYEIEAWIQAGKSLTVPKEIRKTPLAVAMSTRFHSLVDLLLRHEQGQEAKNDALRLALMLDRSTFTELAIAHGADIHAVPFLDVLMTGDRSLVTSFLEKGADAITGHPFAHAFYKLRVKTTLGSYLDCRRMRPDLAEALQEQADMALRQFCQEGNLRWVSLLMWAGASPRSRGPALDDADHADDPEWHTTALEEACASGNLEILKRLRPTGKDTLAKMLERAAFSAHRNILAYLFDIGAYPNDRADGGSSALEACIRHLGWEDFDRVRYGYGPKYLTPASKVSNGREAVKLLLQRGAMWKPEPSTLNDTRRILYRLEPAVTMELMSLLLKTPGGHDGVRELLRVPRMRQHLASCERQLAQLGVMLDGRRDEAHAEAGDPSHQRRTGGALPSKRTRPDTANPPSPYVLRKYNRQKLYEEVWSEPTQRVAQRYGVSDVALSKACKQLQVPKPPRGYWAKRDAGRSVPRRPKLPRLQSGVGRE